MRTDPVRLRQLASLVSLSVQDKGLDDSLSKHDCVSLHYLLWGKSGPEIGIGSYRESFETWLCDPDDACDLGEIVEWRLAERGFPTPVANIPGVEGLHLHAAYGLAEINAAIGLADLHTSGPKGMGVLHVESARVYAHLVTFRKEDRDFAPTTRYKDYLVSRTRLHWESQSQTTQASCTGQNYIHFKERGYTILFFARMEKRTEGETSPFMFLGPASNLVSCEGNRPISMVWDLLFPVPAGFYEAARVV